ncbi:aldo/keto reductase [Streptomyces sp. NRRL WC-3742]|uniref:aldo/keto reductase n=1 Tax=Streptomyces sp. NRRL WC-3742 TaxID=1463934 RepID=UPI0004C4C1AE|nr:aldo/keto reductase [Streptomyces sp. NRRL WC-3742]
MDDIQRPGGSMTLPGGTVVSRLGVGCWPIGGPAHNLDLPMGWSSADDKQAVAGLERAFALGANLFDTADVYGLGHSERLICLALGGIPRRKYALTSKVGYFTEPNAAHAYEPRHMRRRLEHTLTNLGTDYLDVYSLHNANFGPDDAYLSAAVEALRSFQAEGLIRAVGMRGPHRYAPERVGVAPSSQEDKHQRFRRHFQLVQPDVLAVRDNLLTPRSSTGGIHEFAAAYGVTVLVNKPLGQGLLTGKHTPLRPPTFGDGDHRSRKRWFTAPALKILAPYLDEIRVRFGRTSDALVHAALGYCLQTWPGAGVLVGFTTVEQVQQNLACPGNSLAVEDLLFLADVGSRAQQALSSTGKVFTDESAAIGEVRA